MTATPNAKKQNTSAVTMRLSADAELWCKAAAPAPAVQAGITPSGSEGSPHICGSRQTQGAERGSRRQAARGGQYRDPVRDRRPVGCRRPRRLMRPSPRPPYARHRHRRGPQRRGTAALMLDAPRTRSQIYQLADLRKADACLITAYWPYLCAVCEISLSRPPIDLS